MGRIRKWRNYKGSRYFSHLSIISFFSMTDCMVCLNNVYKTEPLPDGWMLTTCQMCGNELRWVAKKRKKQDEKDPCRNCGGKLSLVSKSLNKKRQRRMYHFCKWLRCEKCKAKYYSDEFKKLAGESCACVKSIPVANPVSKNTAPLKSYLRPV